MATQVIELITDDLDGTDADETVQFAYNGADYTIDLNAKNAARLRRALKPFVEHGQKVTAAARKRSSRIEETREGRAMIRTWAFSTNQYQNLAGHGRIPHAIVDAYYAANR